MKYNITKQIGKNAHHFQVEGENFHEAVMEAQKLSFRDVEKCGLCESDNLYLSAYVTKEDKYEYVKIVCAACRASLTFGKSKDKKDTYFLRRNDRGLDWQEYKEKGGSNKSNPVNQTANQDGQVDQTDEIPF